MKISFSKFACAVFVFMMVAAIGLPAQTLTTLFDFNLVNGAGSTSTLIQGTDGSLYGTTVFGGNRSPNCQSDCGTIFKITLGGTLTTLYNFDDTNGENPVSGLTQGADGNFYGVANRGGLDCFSVTCGTAFSITPAGTFTILHNFCLQVTCPDGEAPRGTPVQASDGNLYGATQFGGGNLNACNDGFGCGTLYKMTTSGALTTLYIFCSQPGCVDGDTPFGALIQASDGNLYGTTLSGGANNNGTIFKVTTTGVLKTLYSFSGPSDGENPMDGLVQGSDGNFYGTTANGGIAGGGTVFQFSRGGVLTTLHSFEDVDGTNPSGGLVQATDGYFYGTTPANGSAGGGTLFRINSAGTFTVLHSFCSPNCSSGQAPQGGLVQDTNGVFYGMTPLGGSRSLPCQTIACGTIFRLSVGLAPFVETKPTRGAIGTGIVILGSSLTGATGVTFDGIPAIFTVISDSEISAFVPAGAATGRVAVTTPGGTLTSNSVFRVTGD
jgi:uncharacterized repeat protein (TIGR03803 family)